MVNRPIHSTTTSKLAVGGIYDRIDLLSRDIALDQFDGLTIHLNYLNIHTYLHIGSPRLAFYLF